MWNWVPFPTPKTVTLSSATLVQLPINCQNSSIQIVVKSAADIQQRLNYPPSTWVEMLLDPALPSTAFISLSGGGFSCSFVHSSNGINWTQVAGVSVQVCLIVNVLFGVELYEC